MRHSLIKPFTAISMKDLDLVGGKNASLGEMVTQLTPFGIKIPQGFAITTEAYVDFLETNKIRAEIEKLIKTIDTHNMDDLQDKSKKIRELILKGKFTKKIEEDIHSEIQKLEGTAGKNISFALRSSATAEDLPELSFAGQQESYLNISGFDNILKNIINVYASLYTNRAISYRATNKISEQSIAISVAVQQMVRSDKAVSGVMFTLDTESGFDKVVFINSIYGLGELLVKGVVNPDEFYVFKPTLKNEYKPIIRKLLGDKHQKLIFGTQANQSTEIISVDEKTRNSFSLTDEEILYLAKQACLIEQHYQKPMDIEWAKDGFTNELYILQARPETINIKNKKTSLEQYFLKEKGDVLSIGRSVGRRIGHGPARIIKSIKEFEKIKNGDVLVADMTDPDWEPIMGKLSAIVTNRGGRTCHAAIVARELGIPAVIGCKTATEEIKDSEKITVSCAKGDTGYVYKGLLPYDIKKTNLEVIPSLPIKLMMIIANPDLAFQLQAQANDGVGLARLEFIITQIVGIHPEACLHFAQLSKETQEKILRKTHGYSDPISFYIEKLAESIGTIAAAFWPKPVIIRFSDFKSNEYANLLGGSQFEPHEENPMLGFRGASRYISDKFSASFALECKAIKKVRNSMGLTNVEIMIPFVRTISEAKQVVSLLEENGLKRGKEELKILMMCEVPSNVLLAENFLEYFDGFSIGSNDLTQLTLGIDRDSELVASQFDERNPALLKLLKNVIADCKKINKSIGICGQAPSDYPEFAVWLVKEGIDSVSLNPDSMMSTRLFLAENLNKERNVK